eukprot:gene16405-11729_t
MLRGYAHFGGLLLLPLKLWKLWKLCHILNVCLPIWKPIALWLQ